ncbi:MAG: hypothetical protein HKN47_26340 [Pirellulaceae bacterium]|nr:hypothetical protein [Pirellulaceae bacterium]
MEPAADAVRSAATTPQTSSAESQTDPERATASLTRASVKNLWDQAVCQVEPATATLARSVHRVELSGKNKLRLVFAAESKLSLTRFDSVEHRTAMSTALATLVGQEIQMECSLAPSTKVASKPVPKQSSKDRMQRMREIESHPLVKACSELFGAEIVKVDHPR